MGTTRSGSASRAGSASRGPAPTMLRRAPLAIPVLIVVITGFTHRATVDDGFIYLRIVRNVVEGNGPVFNAGERVEAYTSPTWTALLALGDVATPIRLEWLAATLGILLSAVGMAAAMDGALRLTRTDRRDPDAPPPILVPVGALVFSAPFAVWLWHTSGMETGLVFGWLGGCLAVLGRWAESGPRPRSAALVLLGMGWLVRPELVLFSALFVLVLLAGDARHTTARDRFALIATMVALPLAYQVFRMGYFGSMLANTALAKEGTAAHWDRGGRYLADFISPYWLWVPLGVLLLAGYVPMLRRADLRRRLVVAVFAVGGLLSVLYVVYVGGDYLHARLLLPAFFALCAPVAAVPVERRYAGLILIAPWAMAALFVLRPPQLGDTFPNGRPAVVRAGGDGKVTVDEILPGVAIDRFEPGDTLNLSVGPFGFGNVEATFEPAEDLPEPAFTGSAIGLLGYVLGTDVHIVDLQSLAHPIGSRFDAGPGGTHSLPGHEKPIPAAWLAAMLAAPGTEVSADQLGFTSNDLLRLESGDEFQRQVEQARQALSCVPLQDIEDATHGPLGPGDFLSNIWHAPGNTMVRIPPDPAEAVEALC